MNVYEINDIGQLLSSNSYVGRGIVIGKSQDGTKAVCAYFITGRSENSRNRVFIEKENGDLVTAPFDESKVADPSLILYTAVRRYENKLIVTNGDHTDTIVEGFKHGSCFFHSLHTRLFEPDAPNFTPRISGVLVFTPNDFSYKMSILKSADETGSACNRYLFDFSALPGLGHFLHTYERDGAPVPTFQGEPRRVHIPNDINQFTSNIWNNLHPDNKISLYVCYTDIATGKVEKRIVNKNQR